MKTLTITKTFVVLLFLSFLGVSSISAQFESGTGTKDDPYVITTAEQLNAIRNHLDQHFKLGNNIDLTAFLNGTSTGWTPIGTSESDETAFRGSLNGDGHFIAGFWSEQSTESNGVGLFGWIVTAELKRLGLIVANGKEIKGGKNVGGFIGSTRYSSAIIKITECVVIGNITSIGECAGGIIGYTSNNGGVEITDCYTAGTITGVDKVGGFIGQAYRRARLLSSYSTATIVATGTTSGKAGGLAGEFGYPNGATARHDVDYCIALNPSITGTAVVGESPEESAVGRLVGYNKLNETTPSYFYETDYAFDGMLVNGAVVTGGTKDNKDGLNKTQAEVKDSQTYFDINALYWYDDVWVLGNSEYQLPVLLNLSLDLQPKTALAYLGGGSSVSTVRGNALTVYPNPVVDKVHIQNKALGEIVKVIDNTGRTIIETTNDVIDMSSLSSGIYFIRMDEDMAKVIKQ